MMEEHGRSVLLPPGAANRSSVAGEARLVPPGGSISPSHDHRVQLLQPPTAARLLPDVSQLKCVLPGFHVCCSGAGIAHPQLLLALFQSLWHLQI